MVTAFPRNYGSPYATKEGYRISVNNSILTNPTPPWDAVVDLSLDPAIGAVNAWNNTTYFQPDGVHLTTAGQDKLAVLVKNVIETI